MNNEESRPELIDVRDLIKEVSIEELCRSAEEFFAERVSWESLQSKPFAEINETPELLIHFAQVVRGLKLLPDMTILDFGAGTCWTSRFLTQLGLKVIALDVSPSALKLGRKLYHRHPVIGHKPKPEFLLFDGETIDLPDSSVDRISCWEAFHHVPNPARIITEMGRVLKPGGIVGFSEPGPNHSKSAQAQDEMRTHRVIENDIDLGETWTEAQAAGFTDIQLAVINPNPFLVPLKEFESYLAGGNLEHYLEDSRQQMRERRLFFLFKGGAAEVVDSRQRDGLSAELQVKVSSARVRAGKHLKLDVTAKNTGTAVWLPTPEEVYPWWKKGLLRFGRTPHMGPDREEPRVGGVRFGIQLLDEHGELLDIDYFRHQLTPGPGRAISPGETVEFNAKVLMRAAGKYILHCDLVSEKVSWIERPGSPGVRIEVEVV